MTRRKLNRRAVVVDVEEAYLTEVLAVLQASSVMTWTRVAQARTRSGRTLRSRIRLDRVDPRVMAEVRAGSQAEADLMAEAMKAEADLMAEAMKAEADLMTEATEAEVDWMNPKIDDPTEGWNLRTARKRWMLRPLAGVLEAMREWAEPPCRRKVDRREELLPTLPEMVRLPILLEVFGRRSTLA